MLESCFQRLFGIIRHVEFTFPQNGGGTVCNLRFFFLSPQPVSWSDRLSLRAENLRMDLVLVKDVYFGIRFSVCHIVSVLWHMGGFTKTCIGIRSKFSKDLENNLLDGNTP